MWFESAKIFFIDFIYNSVPVVASNEDMYAYGIYCI